jgi:pimeloyl-ACP methyl ester carboxylesterase
LHQSRDLVMVDQRGTGGSMPLTCPQDENIPSTDFDISAKDSLEQVKTCRQKLDGDPQFYTTTAAVDDLEQVRQALGYPQVNLLGVSYGTRVALVYLRQAGEYVRSVVLDSVDATNWELGPHNAANAQRAVDLLIQRCAADKSCSQAYPDLQKELISLSTRLEQEPVKVSLRHPVSGEKIEVTLDRRNFGFALQILSYEPETAALIPLLVHSAYKDGSYDLLLAQSISSQGSLSSALSTGVYYSVLCAEDVPFYPAHPDSTPSFLQDVTLEMTSLCKAWNTPSAAVSFKQPVQSDRPVLLLSGEADPVTPPSNAAEAARSLPNSLSVVVPGMGHAVFTRGCVPRLLADFISAGSAQGLDTSCVKQIAPQPFFLNFSGTNP